LLFMAVRPFAKSQVGILDDICIFLYPTWFIPFSNKLLPQQCIVPLLKSLKTAVDITSTTVLKVSPVLGLSALNLLQVCGKLVKEWWGRLWHFSRVSEVNMFANLFLKLLLYFLNRGW
jgi:hypothetical protein